MLPRGMLRIRLRASADRDDPAGEVAAVKAALTPLIPKLRKPNPYEPRGQGLFVVPGIFWFMVRQSVPSSSHIFFLAAHFYASSCGLSLALPRAVKRVTRFIADVVQRQRWRWCGRSWGQSGVYESQLVCGGDPM